MDTGGHGTLLSIQFEKKKLLECWKGSRKGSRKPEGEAEGRPAMDDGFDSFLLVFVAGHVKSAGPVGGELLVHGGKQQFEHDDWHRVRPERDIGAVDNSIGNKMKQNKKKTHKKIIK